MTGAVRDVELVIPHRVLHDVLGSCRRPKQGLACNVDMGERALDGRQGSDMEKGSHPRAGGKKEEHPQSHDQVGNQCPGIQATQGVAPGRSHLPPLANLGRCQARTSGPAGVPPPREESSVAGCWRALWE